MLSMKKNAMKEVSILNLIYTHTILLSKPVPLLNMKERRRRHLE
jgi:hypothetical protein